MSFVLGILQLSKPRVFKPFPSLHLRAFNTTQLPQSSSFNFSPTSSSSSSFFFSFSLNSPTPVSNSNTNPVDQPHLNSVPHRFTLKLPQTMRPPKLSFTCVLFLFLLFGLTSSYDLASDRQALLTFRAAVGGRTTLWNVTETNPCSWSGVTCVSDRVTELRAPGSGLNGPLPLGLGNLTQLQALSLRKNALYGEIPADLVNLVKLESFYLQGNRFSGPIPEFMFGLMSLERLDLSQTNFSGEISPGFNKLSKLVSLHLEENQFNGSIPELDLPELGQFNVSYNRLNGPVPRKLSGWPEETFAGNLQLCGKPLRACDGAESESKKNKKLSGGAIAGIVIGCLVGLLIIVAILYFCCGRKKKGDNVGDSYAAPRSVEAGDVPKRSMETESLSGEYSAAQKRNVNGKSLVFFGNAVKVFDLEDLLRASAEVLGKGTFGTAYKAALEMGVSMAVKRLKEVTVSEREFKEKMDEIGHMEHVNLVPLRAYYYSRDEKLLVYDYMPMGSLSALLHGNRGSGRTPLNWETRSGIAVGAARAITYLHSHGPTISHGNIKSSNILLTPSYDACVSDFFLAHFASPTSTPNRISGYRAPEVTDSNKVTQKADVYSFGVLLLEMLTGKPPTQALLTEEGVDLPKWVHSVVREEWTAEVFDLELLRYQNVEDEMVQLLQIALECTVQHPDKRPSMAEVTSQIEEIHNASLNNGLDES